jgi:hypothetical protein
LCEIGHRQREALSPKIVEKLISKKGRERALRIELSLTELKEICKLIPREPEDVLKLTKDDLPRARGEYLSGLIRLELASFRSKAL